MGLGFGGVGRASQLTLCLTVIFRRDKQQRVLVSALVIHLKTRTLPVIETILPFSPEFHLLSFNGLLFPSPSTRDELHLHLQVSDEPLHGDFLFDLQEEAVATQHHALQDVQGHLLYGGICGLSVDKVGNLGNGEREVSDGSG